jgi:hypothetical protein
MMPKPFISIILLYILTSFTLVPVRGQEVNDLYEETEGYPGWNISAAVGTSIFLGDIKTNPLLPALKDRSELGYVAMLAGERRFNPWIASRLHVSYSHVLGTKKLWNVHFQSFVWESGLTGLFYPINFFTGNSDMRFADFYIMAGIGAINYNTTLYQYTSGVELAKLGYGYGKGIGGTTLSGVLIAGLGADFRLSDNFDLRVEISNKGLSNDLLDTWKSNFPFDVYNHFTFGLVYKLGQRGSEKDRSLAPENNQDFANLWSNLPAKPQEKKEVTDNLQFTPVLEIPEEKPAAEPAPELSPATDTSKILTPVAKPDAPSPVNEFRVQIFAAIRPYSKAALAKKFRLNENHIVEDRFQQFYVYSVGSFGTMDEALAMRDKLRLNNGVSDAFVTIWENGQRVGPRFK